MRKAIIVLLLLFVSAAGLFAQADSVQNLYFAKKGGPVIFSKPDWNPGSKAFYLYRNCRYDIVLMNKKFETIRVTDIRNDSICYVLITDNGHLRDSLALLDTLRMHPSNLRGIREIGDRVFGMYNVTSLRKKRFVFEKDTMPKAFARKMDTVYSRNGKEVAVYEQMPYMSAQGVDMTYEQRSITYYYPGGVKPVDTTYTAKKDHAPIVRKVAWYMPTNANMIKGVAVGLQTMQFNEEPLEIRGVNLNMDLLSVFVSFYYFFDLPFNNTLINMPDTVDKSRMNLRIRGLSISGGGLQYEVQMKGCSINLGVCAPTEARGFMLSATQTAIGEFNGVVVSPLRNRSAKGRGVQMGLLNICKDMKGLQVGLWNVNSKRRFPLINWNF